ncbi:MAG: hypothetical protein RLZ44_1220 [Pseudomonadota bacterium]
MVAGPASTDPKIPAGIALARDYETVARARLPDATYAYIAGGAGEGTTAERNLRSFATLAVVPRVLQVLDGATLAIQLPGLPLAHPVLLAPVAHQILVHEGAERETARAAGATGTALVASTLSSCTLETIAAAQGNATRAFQLYLQPDFHDTADLVRRAERAGYTALFITVDAALQVPGQEALRAGFRMPPQAVAANLAGYPATPAPEAPTGPHRLIRAAAAGTPTWDDLRRVKALTGLPVWIKGVMHPEDAQAIRSAGFAGLVVSNHGGRGLDGAPSSLGALPAIRAVLGDDYPVLFDGGVRSGQDVFKAIALGADAVMVGRLQLYALAAAGALGVAHMLRLLREELEVCMALSGCATVSAIRRASLQSGAGVTLP